MQSMSNLFAFSFLLFGSLLFSEVQDFQLEEKSEETTEEENKESDQLFDQEVNEEEDFEIPAFLRKQKF